MSHAHELVTAAHRARKRLASTGVSESGEAVLVRALTKIFPDRRGGLVEAVRDVSFSCHYGEIFGLLGPNGAGKTTTLRMLATILRPTTGTAVIAGHDVTERPAAVRRSIGYQSSNTGLYQRLTARETLEYFGRLHGLGGERLGDRVEHLLELFDMRSFADIRCEKLSTGMRQKVSIARTVVHDPPVLILDEPTLGLDILVASTMMDFIGECRHQGKCVIFSTHIMDEVRKLCGRIGIIHAGRLRAVGRLDELATATGHEFLEDIFMTVVSRATTKALT